MRDEKHQNIWLKDTWAMNSQTEGIAEHLVGNDLFIISNGIKITATLADLSTVETRRAISVPSDGPDIIQQAGYQADKIPENIRTIVREASKELTQITARFVRLLKLYLDNPQISETLLGKAVPLQWSVDGSVWCPYPPTTSCGSITIGSIPAYKGEIISRVQHAMAGEQPPVLIHAMRHLHRAKNEREPSCRWIDATIAAELAIKEFLIAKEPLLETLLLELPSPPLQKLYGQILEKYADERSPKLNSLRDGSEKRNKLIHRPGGEHVNRSEADQYVKNVEIAIYHLMCLLHPEDDWLKNLYEKKVILADM